MMKVIGAQITLSLYMSPPILLMLSFHMNVNVSYEICCHHYDISKTRPLFSTLFKDQRWAIFQVVVSARKWLVCSTFPNCHFTQPNATKVHQNMHILRCMRLGIPSLLEHPCSLAIHATIRNFDPHHKLKMIYSHPRSLRGLVVSLF